MKKRNKIENFIMFNSTICCLYFLFSFVVNLCNGEFIERKKLIVPLLILVLIGVFVIVPLLYGNKVIGNVKPFENIYDNVNLNGPLNNILIEAYMLLSTLIIITVCILAYLHLLTMRDSMIFMLILFICSTYIEIRLAKVIDKVTKNK